MADLVTHLCSAVLPGLVFAPRFVVPLAVGVTLPDISGRAPQMLLSMLQVPLPNTVLWGLDILHSPVAQGLLAGMITAAFRVQDRRRVGAGLMIGIGLHFAVDVLQYHHGHGYYLLFPLSMSRFELGWMGSEATVAWAPWLLCLTAAVAGWRAIRERGPQANLGAKEPMRMPREDR